MDKVIIDNVDISECSYAITPKRQCPNKPMPYAKETSCIGCKEHNTKLNFCKNNPDCYYKQLKRLQAEYDDLHLSYAGCKTANTGLQEVNQKLEQENEQLKKSIDRIMQNKEIKTIDLDIAKENAELKAENERLKDELRVAQMNRMTMFEKLDIVNEKDTYKQALQEIRELIKKLDLSLGCAYGDYDCDNCSDINEETVCKIKLQNIILDKINEVIGAE